MNVSAYATICFTLLHTRSPFVSTADVDDVDADAMTIRQRFGRQEAALPPSHTAHRASELSIIYMF